MQPKISFGIWSVWRIHSSCPGSQLFISEQARGETGFMEDLQGTGVSVWKAFKEVDKAGCTHVRNRIVFYTPLQTELNLSSLPIIPLVNSPFHLIPVVLHVTSSNTDSVSCVRVYGEAFVWTWAQL